jgi:hypothetical protein
MLSVVLLSVILPSVVLLSVVMLSAVMLSGVVSICLSTFKMINNHLWVNELKLFNFAKINE